MTWQTIVDTVVVGAMGPPGGGRNHITPRLLRHFNILCFLEFDDSTLTRIFRTIVNWHFSLNKVSCTTWAIFGIYITAALRPFGCGLPTWRLKRKSWKLSRVLRKTNITWILGLNKTEVFFSLWKPQVRPCLLFLWMPILFKTPTHPGKYISPWSGQHVGSEHTSGVICFYSISEICGS